MHEEIIENTLASALISLPSSALDFKVPELRPYLDQFVRGSNDYTAEDRVKLMKLIWDAIGTEFGAGTSSTSGTTSATTRASGSKRCWWPTQRAPRRATRACASCSPLVVAWGAFAESELVGARGDAEAVSEDAAEVAQVAEAAF